ncbi:hypothetical protein E2C01_034023 [Portunus trituberculatus]|uniref:Uncharacterized protein n=1 Tax=Portunus trituberculatus TaxID=210409 RepID=A0A5B7F506_PORTR|nr:hypothetical protein [Portunus trituberculatus]
MTMTRMRSNNRKERTFTRTSLDGRDEVIKRQAVNAIKEEIDETTQNRLETLKTLMCFLL